MYRRTRKCQDTGCFVSPRGGEDYCRRHAVKNARSTNTHGLSTEEKLRFYGWSVTARGCWEWSGNRFSNGYGQLYSNGKKKLTHRLAYETWVGPIPEGHVVRHKCDNPPCINPDHLETGTTSDNAQDMISRGRFNRTQTTPDSVVHEMIHLRATGMSYAQIGAACGLSGSGVFKILNGRALSIMDVDERGVTDE